MKKYLSNSIFFLFLSCSVVIQAQPRLKIDWGMESTQIYEELAGSPGLRVFLPKSGSLDEKTAEDCQSRHQVLWKEYRDACNKNSKQPDQIEFTKLKKDRDNFCTGYYIKVAPVLYFDFIASRSDEEYVLDSVRVDVTSRSLGKNAEGGFITDEASYDLVLPNFAKGTKSYAVHKKLAFRGHGRLQLRLRSGAVIPEEGWFTRSGVYVLKLTFKFLVNGVYVESHTGTFSIVV